MSNFSRPQYVCCIDYWKSPKLSQNSKEDYLDEGVRQKYADSIVVALKRLFKEDDTFTVHELGVGWGFNLGVVHRTFPNALLSGNGVWVDACEYIRQSVPDITLYELDTFEFIKSVTRKFDVVITNAHLIHLQDDRLHELSELHKICEIAILQENIT